MIKAVIFDLDGLLIDSEIISYQICQEILNRYGHGFSKAEYAQNYSGKTGIANMQNLIRTYQLPLSMEGGLELAETLEKGFLDQGVALKNGAKELLSYLRDHHYKTAVASSSTKDRAFKILEHHGIAGCFDEFVFGNEVERSKPAPDIFLKACLKVSEKPEHCLVLEDSEAGIQAGFSANIPVICIPDLKLPEQEYLDQTAAVLDSLEDVIEYVKGQELERDKPAVSEAVKE